MGMAAPHRVLSVIAESGCLSCIVVSFVERSALHGCPRIAWPWRHAPVITPNVSMPSPNPLEKMGRRGSLFAKGGIKRPMSVALGQPSSKSSSSALAALSGTSKEGACMIWSSFRGSPSWARWGLPLLDVPDPRPALPLRRCSAHKPPGWARCRYRSERRRGHHRLHDHRLQVPPRCPPPQGLPRPVQRGPHS